MRRTEDERKARKENLDLAIAATRAREARERGIELATALDVSWLREIVKEAVAEALEKERKARKG